MNNVDELIKEHQSLAYSHASKMAAMGNDYDSALSNGMVCLWRAAQEYDPELGAFSTFFTTIVKNDSVNKWKKDQLDILSQSVSGDETGNWENSVDENAINPLQHLENKESQEFLEGCMDVLNDREREIIELFYDFVVDDQDISRYADSKGISRTTVYNTHAVALSKLRKCMVSLE